MLAPMFDKMTTHILPQRFSAAEAYEFFSALMQELPDSTLNMQVTIAADLEALRSNAYWERLSPEFCERWAEYRTPRISNTAWLLDRVVSYPLGRRLITSLRRNLHI